MDLGRLVDEARGGDLGAYERLVAATQGMVYAVARRVLGDPVEALDAVQETYLRAYRRLGELEEAEAFGGWLRRIAVHCATDLRRRQRMSFLSETPEVPVLDAAEERWSAEQRQWLAAALVRLPEDERLVCDRFYHGGWSVARLAAEAGVAEAAMRKRLQRIRDRLRKDVEMSEQSAVRGERVPENLPAKVMELLAKPKLTTLPENPVGRMTELLRAQFPGYEAVELAETKIDGPAASAAVGEAIRVDWPGLHRVDATHILRPDLTVAMVLASCGRGAPLRRTAAGQVYRAGPHIDATHLEAFHMFEYCRMEEGLTAWMGLGDLLRVLYQLFPEGAVRLGATHFALCRQAWSVHLEVRGRKLDVAGCGVYTEKVVSYLGGDPARHQAFGVGFGLERLAGLYFGIEDLRTIEGTRV